MSRACDAFGCKATIQSGRFLCINHWRMVPTEVQRVINTRYRALRNEFAFLSDVAYLQAAVDAIDVIATVERQTGFGSYHRLLQVAQRRAKDQSTGGMSK